MWWILQQGTKKSIFRVTCWIDFDIMTTMILQNTISTSNLFWIESFDSGVLLVLWRATKKKICWMSQQENREACFQSNWYDLNWVWHYVYNDSAKYHFQILLISIWRFWLLSVLLWSHTKKNLQNVAASNRTPDLEVHFQSYLLN